MQASFGTAALFTVAGDRTGQYAPGVRVAADCGTDGIRYGTVTAVEYAAETGLTSVTLAPDTAGLTTNLVGVLHGNDIPASLANHGHTGQADGGPVAHAALSGAGSNSHAVLDAHLANTANPHGTTAAQVGARARLTANITLNVATTGSDTTGDGTAAAPYASIAKALASLADKSIDAGVVVTIRVADGTYTVSSPIVVNHPDGDKIQILGNTAAETALTIAAIDTTARTFTVAGEATALLSVGDYCRITTGTAANCGAYSVASVAYDGTNTVIGVNEAIASATVGGASLWVMPANRVRLSVPAGVTAFSLSNGSRLGLLSGLTLVGGTTGMGVYTAYGASAVMQSVILVGFGNAAYAINSGQSINKCVFYNNAAPVRSSAMSYISVTTTGIASSTGVALWADNGGFIRFIYSGLCNCYNSNVVVPAFGVTGNNNAFISNS